MAAKITGASLQPILLRLNNAPTYHPFEADAFSDWSTEAGDIITVNRGSDTYTSPANVTRMVWKGNAPTVQISSTGNKEREPIAKVSRKKYGRGSAGIRSQEGIFRNFTSEDGILHSSLAITESYLRTEFHNESDSLRSYFDMTSSHLRTEFIDEVHSMRGDFEVTVSHMRTEFTDEVNSLHGEFEVTVSHMRTEFTDDVNSLRGEFEVSVSHLRTEFTDDVNSLRGDFEVTVSHMRTEFIDEVNSVRGEFEVTATHLRNEFIDEVNSVRSEFEITATHLRNEFIDEVNSVRSEFEITATHLRNEFIDETNSLRSEFEITATHLRNEFIDEVNSVRSYTEQTASSWETRVEGVVDANGNVTAASIALAVNNAGSSVKINANKIYLLGQTIVDTIDADYISSAIATIPHLYTNHITMDGDLTLGGRLWLLGVNVTSLVSGVKSVRISDPVNNTYKLQYTTYDDDSWQDAGSFSRATTLTGSWGGTVAAGKSFTVTASPQGNIKAGKVYGEIVPDTSDPVDYTVDGNNHYVARDYIIYSEDENGDADVQILKKEVKISADLAYSDGYTTGYEEGSASGGSTTLTNTWNNGHLVVTASPQGEVLERWLSSGTPTFSGTLVSIPINALFGNSQQYSESTGWSASANISSLLQSKTVTSNGTVTPGSGYIGLSSVTVNVPTANARAHFGATSGQYYIEAVDTVSGNPIPNSSVSYSLVASGSNVTISAGSGQTVPSIALGINSGSLSNGSRTLTVTAGGSNTTATVTITDYSAGWSAARDSTGTFPAAAVPEADRLQYIEVKRPSSTVGGTATSYNYYVTSDNDKAYIRYGNTGGSIIAQVTHNKYTTGYNAGVTAGKNAVGLSINSNNAKITRNQSSNAITEVQISLSTGSVNSSGNRTVAVNANGTTLLSNVISDYANGWTAAYNKVTLPANGTGTTMVVKTPPSTVDGNAASTTYTLSSDNNVAYIKVGNDVKAQLTHNKYSNGYTAGWRAYYNTMHFPSSGTTSTMSVYWPGYTPDSSWDSVQRDYVLQNKDDNTVYLRYSNVTYAQFAHNKYNSGWTAAYGKVSLPSSANTSTNYMTVKTPPSTVGGSADETKYYVTSDNSYTYLRKGSTAGTAVARGTNNAYGNGKSDVWANVSIENTCGAADSYETVSGSGANKTVKFAFTTRVKSTGMSDKTKNDYWQGIPTQIWRDAYAEGLNTSIGGLTITTEESYTESGDAYKHYQVISGSYYNSNLKHPFRVKVKNGGGTVIASKDDYWGATPTRIWKDAFKAGWQAALTGATSYWWAGVENGKYNVYTPKKSAYDKIPPSSYSWDQVGELSYSYTIPSTSHSISQSHAVASDLASLANNLGASGSSALTDLGTFTAAGGRNYWGIRVSCGGAVKYYYVRAT